MLTDAVGPTSCGQFGRWGLRSREFPRFPEDRRQKGLTSDTCPSRQTYIDPSKAAAGRGFHRAGFRFGTGRCRITRERTCCG